MSLKIPLGATYSIGSDVTLKTYPDDLPTAEGSYSYAVLKTNPIRYYRMSSDDTGEAIEPDLGSSGQDATHNTNSVLASVGPQKDITPFSREFDGNSQETTSASLSELNGSSEVSIAAWVKITDDTKENYIMSSHDTAASNLIYMHHDNLGAISNPQSFQFGVATSENGRVETSAYSVIMNKWHFVVGTMNSDKRNIYLDGILQGAKTGATRISVNTQTDNLRIGGWLANSNGCNGNIADFAIWDRELSAKEIANLYASACVPNLIAHDDVFNYDNWGASVTITENYGIAPDGTNTSIKIENDSGLNFRSIYYNIPNNGSKEVLTGSLWFRKVSASQDKQYCQFYNSLSTPAARCGFTFTYATETFTPSGTNFIDGGFENAGNGWYRAWFSGTVADSESETNNRFYIYSTNSNPQILGDAVEIWNPQITIGTGPPKPTLDPRYYPRS